MRLKIKITRHLLILFILNMFCGFFITINPINAIEQLLDNNIWICNPTNSHYYKKIIGYSTWHDYEAAAVAESAHLVTINDANEQAWLISTFGGSDKFWIGYTDEITQTIWLWKS